MDYEMIEDREHAGDWRVEGIDREGEGTCIVVLFSGADAKERAEEYLAWKSGPS